MTVTIRRRELLAALGGAAAWPRVARAQQAAMPVVVFLHPGASEVGARDVAAFRKGLQESGYFEGQNVTVEYHWLEGQYDRLPALMADLVRRRVDVIATPAQAEAIAAKAATTTIPIVFGVGEDPVKLGLVASLAHPGGNATGFNSFFQEVAAKRLGFLHELVPKAVRVAVLINPTNATSTESTLRDVQEAANAMGLHIQIFEASESDEINAASTGKPLIGLASTATRTALGTSSCRSPSRLAMTSQKKKLTPVAFPLGRARLATRPSLTGSSPTPNTIGIVSVAALAATASSMVGAAITATRRRTKSAITACRRSWSSATRCSMITLRPSM